MSVRFAVSNPLLKVFDFNPGDYSGQYGVDEVLPGSRAAGEDTCQNTEHRDAEKAGNYNGEPGEEALITGQTMLKSP